MTNAIELISIPILRVVSSKKFHTIFFTMYLKYQFLFLQVYVLVMFFKKLNSYNKPVGRYQYVSLAKCLIYY